MAKMLTTRRIRAGLHEIIGIVCECGGKLQVESGLSSEPVYKWETYCTDCLVCDCNGWPTLEDAIREAPEYFSARETAPKKRKAVK